MGKWTCVIHGSELNLRPWPRFRIFAYLHVNRCVCRASEVNFTLCLNKSHFRQMRDQQDTRIFHAPASDSPSNFLIQHGSKLATCVRESKRSQHWHVSFACCVTSLHIKSSSSRNASKLNRVCQVVRNKLTHSCTWPGRYQLSSFSSYKHPNRAARKRIPVLRVPLSRRCGIQAQTQEPASPPSQNQSPTSSISNNVSATQQHNQPTPPA